MDLGDLERELIVVDDCSQDKSPHIMSEFEGSTSLEPSAKPFDRPIRVLKHQVNMGKGAALRTGFAAAEGRLDPDSRCGPGI